MRARGWSPFEVLMHAALAALVVSTAQAQAEAEAEVVAVAEPEEQREGFRLESAAFEHLASIPIRHTAYGDNVSPPLYWAGAPAEVRSFALVLDDSDAPGPTPFVHWVIYNIPADVMELPEGLPDRSQLEALANARQGPNGVRHVGYFGPRPPPGELHHYNFRLFALHSAPELPEGMDGRTLLDVIRPHVLAETILTGTYQSP